MFSKNLLGNRLFRKNLYNFLLKSFFDWGEYVCDALITPTLTVVVHPTFSYLLGEDGVWRDIVRTLVVGVP